jgi:hypothetical protein
LPRIWTFKRPPPAGFAAKVAAELALGAATPQRRENLKRFDRRSSAQRSEFLKGAAAGQQCGQLSC